MFKNSTFIARAKQLNYLARASLLPLYNSERALTFLNIFLDAAQLSRENKANNRTGAVNAPVRESFDDRPITPMHGTFKQVADQYTDEDNPQYTNKSI